MKIKEILEDKRCRIILILMFALYYMTAFMVVLKSGYMYDDMWKNVDKGLAMQIDTTLPQYAWDELVRWVQDYGRILIFSHYAEFALCCLPLVGYKLLIVISTFLGGIVISLICFELTKSRRIQYLVLLIFPAVISFRTTYYSPLYGFHGLMQICFLLIALALYWYIIYRKTGLKRFEVLSCIAWFVALGTYEVSYILSLSIFIIIFSIDGWENIKKNSPKILKTIVPQLIIFGVWIVLNFVARAFATGQYDGTRFEFDLSAILITFFKQCSGGIGAGSTIHEVLNYGVKSFLSYVRLVANWYHIVFLLIFVTIYVLVAYAYRQEKYKKMAGMVVLGIALVILPSSLISLSHRYQYEVDWFTGYIPVYFAAWGFAIILVALLVWIGYKLRNKKILYIIFQMLTGLFIGTTLLFNNAVGQITVTDQNDFYQNDVYMVREAIDAGIMDDLGDSFAFDITESTFTTGEVYTKSAYSDWMNRLVDVYAFHETLINSEGKVEETPIYLKRSNPFYIINYEYDEFFTISKCDEMDVEAPEDKDSLITGKFYTDELYIYVHKSIKTLNYKDKNGNDKVINLSEYSSESSNKNGDVYRIPVNAQIDIASISAE